MLGTAPCGVPVEEITKPLARTGTFFALEAKGDSMAPEIKEGEILIVKQTNACDSGQVAIVKVNGDEATCIKIRFGEKGVTLIPYNSNHETKFYLSEEIEKLPITIYGIVVEARRKFA